MSRIVPFVPGMRALSPRYDGFVLDVWGVIHDGVAALPGALDCLARLDEAGGRFVMLTNAPRRADAVAAQMRRLGVPEAFAGRVMSSGEATWRDLKQRGDPWYEGVGARVFHLGPERDRGILDGLGLEEVTDVAAADLLLNTGPWQDRETVADFEDLLAAGAAHGVAMVCANPDVEVIRGGTRIICAGALAGRYEALGGRVRRLGKPYPAIYETCLAELGIAARARILAVGDGLNTDIAGAATAGLASALVLGGLHAAALDYEPGQVPDEAALWQRCRALGAVPDMALPAFVW